MRKTHLSFSSHPSPLKFCISSLTAQEKAMAVLSSAENHLPQEWHLKRFPKGKMDGLPQVVCVTNGTSSLGLFIVVNLLRRGYFVRITVDTSEELEKLREMEELARYRNRVAGVVGNITAEDSDSLSEKFDGCYGVFHTSSFVDPHSVSGFTEHMVNLEVQGAEKVVEACCLASSVRRLVFTSSMAACIWHSQGIGSNIIVDEKCWSDPSLCRERKLWYALAKTMAEKAAWRVARERGGPVMATICPAFLTGPASSSSSPTSSIACFKGAKEMFEKKVLATVDVQKAAEAHVCVYQEMCEGGASGRYICFDNLIKTPSDALHLEKKLNFNMGFSQGIQEDNDAEMENGRCVISADRMVNAKLERVMAKWRLQPNEGLMGIM